MRVTTALVDGPGGSSSGSDTVSGSGRRLAYRLDATVSNVAVPAAVPPNSDAGNTLPPERPRTDFWRPTKAQRYRRPVNLSKRRAGKPL